MEICLSSRILDTGRSEAEIPRTREYWILDGKNLFLLIKEPVLSEAEGGVGDCCAFRVPSSERYII